MVLRLIASVPDHLLTFTFNVFFTLADIESMEMTPASHASIELPVMSIKTKNQHFFTNP